jgi:hypothetical protein
VEPKYLKQIVSNEPQGTKTDLNAPFSYLEWKQRRPSLAEKDAPYHYQRYVLEWFANNKEKQLSQKFVLRQKYLYLLDQLQLFFSEEEKNLWYNKVNLADEKELLLAIPYFAKKLKDISLYYLKLRNKLKNTKVKYNTVGTPTSIEQEIYRYLFETFSSLNNELDPSLQTVVPQFSALQDSLVIQVEEVYDDHVYFDQSTSLPVSGYYNLFHDATEQFFLTKGIVLSSSEWLFSSLSLPLSSDVESFVSELTSNILETSDADLYGSFLQNYLSEDKYTVTFTAASSVTETTDVPLQAGNNYFYYPYGTLDNSVAIKGKLTPVALSSLKIEGATAGATIEDSDVVFVKNGERVESAWLYYKDFEQEPKTVKSSLKQNSTTSFIFPFPGYGLSGINIPWTGSSLEFTQGFDFLSKDLKAQVNQAYWSQTLPADTHDVILLNNTTLISSGAIPNKNPNFADQVYIRTDRTEDTTIPYGELSGAWLYRFERTSLPVSPNSTNVLLWPYGTVNEESEFNSYLEKISFAGACNAVSIQDISTSLSIAASSFELADKIYKVNNYKDESDAALECAWLSAAMVQLSGYKTHKQDGFSALFAPGVFTRFLWQGPETSVNDVFATIPHSADCPFTTNTPSVSSFEWQKCTCKQVYYSPFGHTGRQLQDNNMFADCVIEDTTNKLDEFDFGSWRDSLSGTFESSTEIAWYKTKTKHSWGDGAWTSNNLLSTTPLTLKPGKVYFYYRATSKTQEEQFPPYSVNYKFLTPATVWAEAKLQADGTWAPTEKSSQMKLNAGDFIRYERRPTTTSYLLSTVEVENTSENINTVWSSFDKIAINSDVNYTAINWPFQQKPFGSTDPQYPSTQFTEITAINAWRIERLEDGEQQWILNTFAPTFTPPITGTYSIAVTATKVGGARVFESTNIPLISVVPEFSDEEVLLDFTTSTNGFLIEHDLFGWNYNTNKAQQNAPGARPYWAELYLDKSSSTRFKGIYSWGYPNNYIDSYLPNHSPIISPFEISYGSVIDYNRKSYTLEWKQPINYKTFVDDTQWCYLSATTSQFSNLSSIFRSKRQEDLSVYYNTSATPITLTNTKNGLPVEILYYALSSFVWTVSTDVTQDLETPTPELFFSSPKPWANLPNRFYPTVATVPVLEDIYTRDDVGGYFLPQNLGASQFINKEFTTSLKTLNLSGEFLTENEKVHIGGRGLSKQDQDSLYDWQEKNQWLKEPPVAGQLAGAVKKSLTKSLQTFVPYQTNSDQTFLGLVTPSSRVSPWGGPEADQWTDTKNEPKSFTGVRNVSAWADTQILKQNEQVIDYWSSDIFGNQYGLFKDLSGVKVSQRPAVLGELWTRTNEQLVNPAYKSLSAIFDLFQSDETFYSQLTGKGIRSVDCFFDTLLIETSLSAIYIQIDYDYDEAKISAVFDNIIKEPLNENRKFEQTWFLTDSKKLITLYTVISGSGFYPELTEFDLSTKLYTTKFPNNVSNSYDVWNSVSDIPLQSLSKAALHFNNTKQSYLLTYKGVKTDGKLFVVDYVIDQTEVMTLKTINRYIDNISSDTVLEPPVVLNQYLNVYNTNLTPTIQVSATNNPTGYSITSGVSSISATNSGVFTGLLPSPGLYHINYNVSNQIGFNTFCLTISAT